MKTKIKTGIKSFCKEFFKTFFMFILVSGVVGLVFAAITSLDQAKVSSGEMLSSEKWNYLVKDLDKNNRNFDKLEEFLNAGKFSSVSAGYYHTCALLDTGKVKCWGKGNLGDRTLFGKDSPVFVSGINNAASVSAGAAHTCAVLNTGKIKCWGSNTAGKLGDGAVGGEWSPVFVSGIYDAVSLSAGAAHTCAVLNTGKIECWGRNNNGQLGDGTKTNRNTPVLVSGIYNSVSVSAGRSHTCALLNTGKIKCWGSNYNGQLGDGTTTQRDTPVLVSGINNAVSVSLGANHTCAVLNTGEIKCWGYNAYGQLGNGFINTGDSNTTPVLVSGINNAVSVSAGYYHTCAVLSTGEIKCWKYDTYGRLVKHDYTRGILTPLSVYGINNAASVSVGTHYLCSVLSTGEIKCLGDNDYGQLGNGTRTSSRYPVKVYNKIKFE